LAASKRSEDGCLPRSTPLDPYHRTKADKHWVFSMFDPYHYPYHSVPNRTRMASGSKGHAIHQRVQDPILQGTPAERSQIIERRITVAGSPWRQPLETVSARCPDTAPGVRPSRPQQAPSSKRGLAIPASRALPHCCARGSACAKATVGQAGRTPTIAGLAEVGGSVKGVLLKSKTIKGGPIGETKQCGNTENSCSLDIAAPGTGALRQLGNTPSKCALSLPCHHLLFDFCGRIP